MADTMVLRTEFRTESGTVVLTDATGFGPDERGHRIGRALPHVIVRRVERVDGVVDVNIDLAPRAGYGLTELVLVGETGGIRARHAPDAESEAWSERAGGFRQSFGSEADPRMRARVDAVATALTDGRGFVYRYRAADGLSGEEGTFGVCTFWLVQCMAELGEVERARELFQRLTSFANDVGLLSEQLDGPAGCWATFPKPSPASAS